MQLRALCQWMLLVLPTSTEGRAATCVPWNQETLTRATPSLVARCGQIVDRQHLLERSRTSQETLTCFEDVYVPPEYIFMDGEVDFTQTLVERFTAYHRRSYVCKAGLGDVMLGAAATVADYNGVAKASHIKDKLVEIAYLNENIAGTAMASSYGGQATPSGNFLPDVMMPGLY
eukprot:g21802.t1